MEGLLSLEMLHRLVKFFRALCTGIGRRWDRRAIRDADALAEFVATRAAHVGQTALYGYLKTRMGTRQVEIFQDPAFAGPLGDARDRVVRACISDLTVFAVALLPVPDRVGLSDQLFRDAMKQALGLPADDAFTTRLRATDWASAAEGERAFTESPATLLAAAPVSEAFRQADREIIDNSIRFRWADVRRQLRQRLDPAAFGAEKTD